MSQAELREPRTYRDIMVSLNAIDKLYKDGEISEPLYFESLIYIAYEYIKAEFYDSAFSLIVNIPETYFQNDFTSGIESDNNFKDTAQLVYNTLLRVGLIVPPPSVNVPEAKA